MKRFILVSSLFGIIGGLIMFYLLGDIGPASLMATVAAWFGGLAVREAEVTR